MIFVVVVTIATHQANPALNTFPSLPKDGNTNDYDEEDFSR